MRWLRHRALSASIATAVLASTSVAAGVHPALAYAGSPDTTYNSLWSGYGNGASCADWSGGDATNSVLLPSGDRAWFFSDTFLGSPADRKTLFYRSTLRNSIVLQRGSSLRTITGGNTCQERNTSISFWSRYAHTPAPAPDASSGGFYWTGDQMVVGSNILKFYYHGTPSTFPFVIDSSAVATIPISSIENDSTIAITPLSFTQLCADGPTSIIWGAALLSWGGYVYIYGWSTANRSLLYLARTTTDSLTNPFVWQTFNGLDGGGNPVWSTCGNVRALPITLGSGFSVASINGGLWLIQEDRTSNLAGGTITAHPAAQPWLFDDREVPLYAPPEGHHDYPYYYLTYEPRLQRGLASGSSYVVISYNVNSTAVDTGCVGADAHDASIYRPRFVDVPTTVFSASSAATATVQPGTMLPALSYGIQDDGPTSLSPSPAVNEAGTTLSSAAGSGAKIDGVSDWYDQWGSLAGGCPGPRAPPSLTASPPTPLGEVTLSWRTVGTDVWYYGYQADVTAGSAYSKMWGGLWVTPSSSTATSASQVAEPVTSKDVNGHTFAWYIKPFGAGGSSTTRVSPTASERVAVQPPSAPTGLSADHGSAPGQFRLAWTDVTYPSSSVYYWIYYWDIDNGESPSMPGGPHRAQVPAPPGTTWFVLDYLTSGHRYGFYVRAENLGGLGPPSNQATATPTPSCGTGLLDPTVFPPYDLKGYANQLLTIEVLFPYPDNGAGPASVEMWLNDGTGGKPQDQKLQLAAGNGGTFSFSIFGTPPIWWDVAWGTTAVAPLTYSIWSHDCY